MDKNLIERYKQEMLQMYKGKLRAVNIAPVPRETPPDTLPEEEEMPPMTSAVDDTGKLIAIVTTVRSLYPVPNAKITVFTGGIDDMEVIATDFTDESGRTDAFVLQTPSKSLSMNLLNEIRPYGLYNMMVEADGYIPNIHLNIPVFSTITSLQNSNMTLLETAGVNKGPQIFDELQNYTL